MNPVAVFVAVTVAPGTAAPCSSRTRPEMLPDVCCANAGAANAMKQTRRALLNLLIDFLHTVIANARRDGQSSLRVRASRVPCSACSSQPLSACVSNTYDVLSARQAFAGDELFNILNSDEWILGDDRSTKRRDKALNFGTLRCGGGKALQQLVCLCQRLAPAALACERAGEREACLVQAGVD